MLSSFLPAIAALAGLIFGSFLNVVIGRLPEGGSVVTPPSRCPSCGHRLRPWENVPVVSWLILRGRCSACKNPISSRYILVELATGALFALAAAEFGPTLQTVAACALSAFAVVTLFVDIDHLLILDSVTVPAALVALVVAIATGRTVDALEGAAVGIVLFGVIYIATRGGGLGFGDVKLAGCLGLFLGLAGSIAAFAAAFIIGAILALPVLATRKRRAKDVLPLGPFLVLGSLVVTFTPALVFGPYDAYQWFLYRHLGGS
ncbi:MAG TPA: prepilin peptidase [Candidatus Acidoferrales bacterium]|nr:prepilin peptidase [Candidatus Acidoferrales bacterium]